MLNDIYEIKTVLNVLRDDVSYFFQYPRTTKETERVWTQVSFN